MKKLTRIFMLTLLLLSLADKASAQYTFVVDAMFGDSTALYPYDSKWNESGIVHAGEMVGMLPNGTEVIIAQGDTVPHSIAFKSMKHGAFSNDKVYYDDVIPITYNGTKYLVLSRDLMLSPSDATGTVDFLNKTHNRHNYWGHL